MTIHQTWPQTLPSREMTEDARLSTDAIRRVVSEAVALSDPQPQTDILRSYLMARRRSIKTQVLECERRRQGLLTELAEVERVLGVERKR